MGDDIKSTNIVWHDSQVSRADRERLHGHQGAVLWFTGLSGSGKSTLANAVEKALHELGCRTYLLDGDNVRHGLNKNLTFSAEDRVENIRRTGEVARLFLDAGTIVLTAFISPYRADREQARLLAQDHFFEVYVDADLEVCESRDPKGLYKKARAGEIGDFTGISAPYEAPESPEILVNSGTMSIDEEVAVVLAHLRAAGVLS